MSGTSTSALLAQLILAALAHTVTGKRRCSCEAEGKSVVLVAEGAEAAATST